MNWEENYSSVLHRINSLQSRNIEFIFGLNYEKTKGFAIAVDDLSRYPIHFSFNEHTQVKYLSNQLILESDNLPYSEYKKAMNEVVTHILNGNSYLCNLTFRTPIRSNLNLNQIYKYSNAKYKFLVEDQFTFFSPESFIRIENNIISTYPMKGTIRANIPNAVQLILSNKKEIFEHNTIVDLLRNDLSIVANDVKTKRLKYLEKIYTNKGDLIQMSSEICGSLKSIYCNQFGTLLDKLLPAGSISGAPKQKTCEIISTIENHTRNYYTGIFGHYKNNTLDSAVAIRFIENSNGSLYFRSGGGITALSNAESEYEEMINKIYVPIF